MTRRRRAPISVAFLLMVLASAADAAAPPATVYDWLSRQHQLMQRYLKVLRQASHDLAYDYRMPTLMLPIATDLFTGYIMRLHELEQQVLYPAVRTRMTPEQQQGLAFIEQEIDSEKHTMRSWQTLEAGLAPDGDDAALVDAIDYLAQMLNRHVVLQEQRVFPVLGRLSPAEQAAALTQIDALERRLFGPEGRRRYDALLVYIEGEIARISPLL